MPSPIVDGGTDAAFGSTSTYSRRRLQIEVFPGGGSEEEEALLDSWSKEPDADGLDDDLGFMKYNDPNGFLLP